MSSTELLEAASSSCMLYERPSANERQDSQTPQGTKSSEILEQLMVLQISLRHWSYPHHAGHK